MADIKKIYFISCFLISSAAIAGDTMFLEASCKLAYPEAMLHLQDTITKKGYTVSRVQHVDKGLITKGYNSKSYKVVFFGKQQEIKSIKSEHPQLIPFIPLSITLIEKSEFNIISGLRPKRLGGLFKKAGTKALFSEWEKDYQEIFTLFQQCDEIHAQDENS